MDIKKLQNNYFKWHTKQFKIKQTKDWHNNPLTYICTPYTNSVGDNIAIYLNVNQNNQTITLNDDGDTISDLSSMNINILKHPYKKPLMKILNHYHINLVDRDMLQVSGSISNFPKLEFNLIKGINSIYSIYKYVNFK